jgi:ABC-type multidrug transport system fused ATPase/permease subunit
MPDFQKQWQPSQYAPNSPLGPMGQFVCDLLYLLALYLLLFTTQWTLSIILFLLRWFLSKAIRAERERTGASKSDSPIHDFRKKLDKHNLPYFLSDSDVCRRCDSNRILVLDLSGPKYSGLDIRGQYRVCLDCGYSELTQEMLQKAKRQAIAKEAQSNRGTKPTNSAHNSHQ